jgi:hypothetical protein
MSGFSAENWLPPKRSREYSADGSLSMRSQKVASAPIAFATRWRVASRRCQMVASARAIPMRVYFIVRDHGAAAPPIAEQ